jgi:tellurite resistance protein TerC
MTFSLAYWIGFLSFVLIALALDLGVFHKRDKALTFKDAATMSTVWFTLAMIFCVFIRLNTNSQTALEFLTGYIVELSLSMDNVFVFVLIFGYFKIPVKYQHRVLFWGIIGAIVMRFAMITGGIYLFKRFEWIFYIFGAFLIYTGYKIAFSQEKKEEVGEQKNAMISFLSKFFRITPQLEGNKFWVKVKGKWACTPLFIVLLLVEKTDLIFALDSIPAIIAITQDPFIVFTSNIFAILGLRSLYFLLASVIHKFSYLKYGIAIILMFVGFKMLGTVADIHIPVIYSLTFIVLVLSGSIWFSLWKNKQISK